MKYEGLAALENQRKHVRGRGLRLLVAVPHELTRWLLQNILDAIFTCWLPRHKTGECYFNPLQVICEDDPERGTCVA